MIVHSGSAKVKLDLSGSWHGYKIGSLSPKIQYDI